MIKFSKENKQKKTGKDQEITIIVFFSNGLQLHFLGGSCLKMKIETNTVLTYLCPYLVSPWLYISWKLKLTQNRHVAPSEEKEK